MTNVGGYTYGQPMTDRYTESPADLLPIGAAARALGVSVDTIRRWESDGLISSTRTLGNQRRFRRSDIAALAREAVPS